MPFPLRLHPLTGPISSVALRVQDDCSTELSARHQFVWKAVSWEPRSIGMWIKVVFKRGGVRELDLVPAAVEMSFTAHSPVGGHRGPSCLVVRFLSLRQRDSR